MWEEIGIEYRVATFAGQTEETFDDRQDAMDYANELKLHTHESIALETRKVHKTSIVEYIDWI